MQLRSHIAVAMAWAGGYSFDLTPSLGISVCHGCGPKKTIIIIIIGGLRVKQIALHNGWVMIGWVGLIQSAEGLKRTKIEFHRARISISSLP